MSWRIERVIATCGGVGYLPIAPGSFASLISLLFFLRFLHHLSASLLVLIFLLAFFVGMWAADKEEKENKKKDPSHIVIDEALGMYIALLIAHPLTLHSIVVCFLIFRCIDILKPYPIGYIEQLKGSAGIIGDDLYAGFVAGCLCKLFF